MGDMGELFNDWRKMKQEKRASNREASARLLREAGIPYVERNMGAHLMVDGRIDFWPGTGKWIPRGQNKGRRGVASLIRYVRETTPAAGRSAS